MGVKETFFRGPPSIDEREMLVWGLFVRVTSGLYPDYSRSDSIV